MTPYAKYHLRLIEIDWRWRALAERTKTHPQNQWRWSDAQGWGVVGFVLLQSDIESFDSQVHSTPRRQEMPNDKKAQTIPLPYNTRLKVIRERLNRARRAERFKQIPIPAKVEAAQKIVADWEDRNMAASEAHYAKHTKKVREVEDAMILGDGEKVVALLNAMGV